MATSWPAGVRLIAAIVPQTSNWLVISPLPITPISSSHPRGVGTQHARMRPDPIGVRLTAATGPGEGSAHIACGHPTAYHTNLIL
jgi:hypothetical protein